MDTSSSTTGPSTTTHSAEERHWALACHISVFLGLVLPFGNLLGPFILWLWKRDEFPLVKDQAKEVLNFQISLTLYLIASALLCFIIIGFFTTPALLIFALVVTVVGAVKASEGVAYRYPLSIRFIK